MSQRNGFSTVELQNIQGRIWWRVGTVTRGLQAFQTIQSAAKSYSVTLKMG